MKPPLPATTAVLNKDIYKERCNQLQKWGRQSLPDGTGAGIFNRAQIRAKQQAEVAAFAGDLTWADVLTEEFWEALSERDTRLLRSELVQVAAVAVAWIEDLDRRHPVVEDDHIDVKATK